MRECEKCETLKPAEDIEIDDKSVYCSTCRETMVRCGWCFDWCEEDEIIENDATHDEDVCDCCLGTRPTLDDLKSIWADQKLHARMEGE